MHYKLSGSARGHLAEEHHLEGQPEHLGRGGQQDGDRETQGGRQAKLQGQAQGERTIGGLVIVNADCDIVIDVKFRIFCFQRVAINQSCLIDIRLQQVELQIYHLHVRVCDI